MGAGILASLFLSQSSESQIMTVRIAQISDTHLSASKPVFERNFDVIAEHLRRSAPDLVIHTGDISLDGADSDEDLSHAIRRQREIGLDIVLLAGNHDVGDDPSFNPRQPANPERLARWMRHVPQTGRVIDIPGWRLICIDALILGTDLIEANAQDETIRMAITSAAGRKLALFLHKPVCDEALDETVRHSRFLTPQRRAHLLALFAGTLPEVISSGHVHQYRDGEIGGSRHIWAPATSFLISDPWQPGFGAKTVGYLEHVFEADGTHTHRLVTVRGLNHHDLLHVPEAYGDIRRWGQGGA